MGLKSFAILFLKHWISMLRARQNMLEAIMSKDLSKNIIKRLQLRNKYLKNNNEENRKLYNKQRNYCISEKPEKLSMKTEMK